MDKKDDKYGPTYITITEKPAKKLSDIEETHDARKRRVKPKKLFQPSNKELDALSGKILHKVVEDGEVSICIRASTAGTKNPMRFALRVEEADDEEEDETQPGDPGLGVDHHLSFMETEMTRIERSMHHILSEANYAKERDSIFHKQSNDMHSASLFWPIMHVGIVLVTGFTQASHIVRFFKSRRII